MERSLKLSDKFCKKCTTLKPIEEFYRCAAAIDGAQASCKTCDSKQNRDWHLSNLYGLTPEFVAGELEKQAHKCLVCDRQFTGKRWVIDHCHETGNYRGILCVKCNASIGSLGDSVEGLMRAVNYLKAFNDTRVAASH